MRVTADFLCILAIVLLVSVLTAVMVTNMYVEGINRPYDDCVNAMMADGVSESHSRVSCIKGY